MSTDRTPAPIAADRLPTSCATVPLSAAAIRDALDPDWRAEFEAAYWVALGQDERRPDVGAVAELLGAWWPRAVLCEQLGGQRALERAVRESRPRR